MISNLTYTGYFLWWFLLGMAMIIGGIALLMTLGDRKEERLKTIEANLEQTRQDLEELREKELRRARREIQARERRKNKRPPTMTLTAIDEVEFYKSVQETIDGL